MPYLLDYFYKRADKSVLDKNLLNEYNPVNNVPDDFSFAVKAVSYTHLDVYKRQEQSCRRRPKAFSLTKQR